MKRIHVALSTVAAAMSCTHDLNRTLPPIEGNQSGATKLVNADFGGARDDYMAVLVGDPHNEQAALGYVIADLLSAPDWPPVVDFLARMSQPRFNLANDLFGASGYLAAWAKSLSGTAAITVMSGATDVSLDTRGVKARIFTSNGISPPMRTLFVSIRQRTDGATRIISMEIDLGDPVKHGSGAPVTPLGSGQTIDASKMNGYVSVYEPGTSAGSGTGTVGTMPTTTGTIEFIRVPSAAGDAYEIAFHDVTVPCNDPCSGTYAISGHVTGVIGVDPTFDTQKLPFGVELSSSSFGQGLIAAIMRASAFDTAFVTNQLKLVGDRLAADASRLDFVVAAADADTFSYTVPAGLFHTPEDFHLNITDVRVLRAILDLSSAALELGAQYQYLGGNVVDLIGREQGSSSPAFIVSLVQPNLAQHFLARADHFDLSTFKTRLSAGLDAAYDALTKKPQGAGIFDFTAQASTRQFQDLASAVDAVRSSIASSQPVTVPSAPLFQVWLQSEFAQPLDRDRLLMLSGLTELVRLAPGSTDGLEVETGPFTQDPDHAFGGVVHLPPNRNQHCSSVADCGAAGYVCDGAGTCQPDAPYMFSDAAFRAALENEWPVYVDPVLRDVFDLSLF